jgi:hypothetical protein
MHTSPSTLARLIQGARRGSQSALAAGLLGIAALCPPAAQAADVGISIGISQPGVYGRIDIGRYPQPVLVQTRPVYVERVRSREPVYLWVPPGHRKNWRKHCYRYEACGAPVYFVQDRWYEERVMHDRPRRYEDRDERYRRSDDDGPRRDHGYGHGRDKHKYRDHGRDRYRDDR